MIIMGIDPGLAIIGYGFVEKVKGTIKLIDFGIITTPAGMPLPQRLSIIYNDTIELIKQYKPENIAFEELFFNKNIKTALTVAHARGVSIIAANNQIGSQYLFEYTPLQVKQAISGYGRADKQQMQFMVKTLLSMKEIPKPDDAADALAVAICHAQSYNLSSEFTIK
ncbi:MAG: crossover junction endodeoxyribonuclease RuvC [Clostridiales bacterium]|nr:crossover junction endodeoxyribonuclease RuvC [Clostridiales bacterium]